MDSGQVFKVGDRVICDAPETITCHVPVRPHFGADLVIDEIRVKDNMPWLIFHSISKKYGYQAKYFRKPDREFASKILRKMKKETQL